MRFLHKKSRNSRNINFNTRLKTFLFQKHYCQLIIYFLCLNFFLMTDLLLGALRLEMQPISTCLLLLLLNGGPMLINKDLLGIDK